MIGLYLCIPNVAWFKVLKNALDARAKYSHRKLLEMAEFVLKNSVFEFNGAGKKQMSDNVVGTKCVPSLCMHFYGRIWN